MRYPIEVILQRCESLPDAEADVFASIAQLEEFCDHILRCQVFIRGPSAGDEQVYGVNLIVCTPDAEITISGGRSSCREHRDLRRALDDAFAQAARGLHELALPLCTCSGATHTGQNLASDVTRSVEAPAVLPDLCQGASAAARPDSTA